jgi:hypothetical protein
MYYWGLSLGMTSACNVGAMAVCASSPASPHQIVRLDGVVAVAALKETCADTRGSPTPVARVRWAGSAHPIHAF